MRAWFGTSISILETSAIKPLSSSRPPGSQHTQVNFRAEVNFCYTK